MLRGRRTECETLDGLLEALRAGASRALVVRGEAGVGKSALLAYLVDHASGCRVARAAGVQSEMELAFAALHQLCAPLLDRLDGVPGPQRDALGTAFGMRTAPAPDRFMVGLAVLSLLAEVAEEQPLVCVIDDVQWLDRASAQSLAFVARRLLAEPVALVFAIRERSEELTGLPELLVDGLGDDDARALLGSVVRGRLDEGVRDRIVAETRGNPLALLELPRGMTHAELAGGFGVPDAMALPGRIEASFQRRLEPLPADTRRLMVVAAAEPAGDPVVVLRAVERLGIRTGAAAAAAAADLLELGAGVRFRHPLVRSAVYRAAPAEERRSAHRALAEATDPQVDPDRRAWHRAHATSGPDEAVAGELERSADGAQARGGLAAAAALLEHAATLTPDAARRAERQLAAAEAKLESGAPDAALRLLAMAQTGPLDEWLRARVALLRGEIALTVHHGSDAPPLLLDAAKQFETLDVSRARETYLEALSAAMFAAHLADDGGLVEAAWTARGAPPAPHPPRVADLLLDGLALHLTEGARAAAPTLRRAVSFFGSRDVSTQEELRWLWMGSIAAVALWDDAAMTELADRHVQLARDAGALTSLILALSMRVASHFLAGELAEAASLAEETRAITTAIGTHITLYGDLEVAAWRGREREATALMQVTLREAASRSEGVGLLVTWWTGAVLYNSLGRYEDARVAAELAAEQFQEPGAASWSLSELVEAATRTGRSELAADALRRLSSLTIPVGSDWALGIERRSRALLSDGEVADGLYREAIERLGRTGVRGELARAHLLYGEWLRRERRRIDAREHLRTAHALFTEMGMEAFARRAARELLATGETVRRRTADTGSELTPQEAQIARLARDGLSNPEIGARLFISPRTVEYHLRKVFAKLDITSRNQLGTVLSGGPSAAHVKV